MREREREREGGRDRERAGSFALFVFLASRYCCVALSRVVTGLLQFVIQVFPDHTH